MPTAKPGLKLYPAGSSYQKTHGPRANVARSSLAKGSRSSTSLEARDGQSDDKAWQDVDGSHREVSSEQIAPVPASTPVKAVTARARPTAPSSLDLFYPLRLVMRIVWMLVRLALPWFASLGVLLLAVLVAYVLARQFVQQAASGVTAVALLPTTLLRYSYCSTIGLGCDKPTKSSGWSESSSKSGPLKPEFIASTAHETSVRAGQALDLFQSFAHLGGPRSEGLSLHATPIWELANVVRWSTQLEERVFLSNELNSLGNGIRSVKDEIIKVNSQGHATFKWTLEDFSRLQQVIKQAQQSPHRYNENQMSSMVDKFFQRMDSKMGQLLDSLEKVIPLAEEVSAHSRLIRSTFSEADSTALATINQLSMSKFLPATTDRWKYLQLQKDLKMTNSSIETVGNLLHQLENTRDSLVAYRESVGQYKAAILGYHLSGISLTVESEVLALDSVMTDFRAVVADAKKSIDMAPAVAPADNGK
ncbi:hypothetical protein ACM66B_001548 [Microbotryomycetes sp. NB124-2]